LKTLEPPLARLYEDLANHFAHQGDSRQRDQCLVLAADAALTGGQPPEAERLRKRLLLTNPHHLLRPYASMAEAMESADMRDFVLDLRKQWPPETVAKLLNRAMPVQTPASYALEPPPPMATGVARAQPRMATPAIPKEEASPGAYWLAVLVFVVGVAIAGGAAFIALGWPLVE
jgi:hypothetical protein